ncbi:MAG: FecR domain-containing protein [Betaproteobacteria bacterium]
MDTLNSIALATALSLASLHAMAGNEAGVVKISKGEVVVERDAQKLQAVVGTRIFASDRVITGADGAVGITLQDSTLLSAGPNSTVDLNKFAFDSTTHAGAIDATVKRGTLSVISGKIAKATPEAVRFSAPGMTLGVRGTSFLIDAGP